MLEKIEREVGWSYIQCHHRNQIMCEQEEDQTNKPF